jgi:single-strand DNA-binding protein
VTAGQIRQRLAATKEEAMSTTITFAGNLAEEPELHYARDDKPFVSCRVLVNRRVQTDEGVWVNGEPTPHNVKVYGSAAAHVHDSCGTGDPIFVHGLERTESWGDKETGEKRTKDVVVVDNRFGDIGISLKDVSARIDRASRAAAVS